jgi:hypothetical protein
MYVMIKARADRPPNPKILVGEEEIKMRKWANRKAAEMMREQGKPASGPEWDALRQRIIEEIKTDPETHGVSYLGNIPEGFSEGGPRQPDVEGEQGAIDDKFRDTVDEDLSSVEVTPRDDPGRIRREGPSDIEDIVDASTTETERAMTGQVKRPVPEEEEEKPERDPKQTSLFDFGLKTKSEAMNFAWSHLNY